MACWVTTSLEILKGTQPREDRRLDSGRMVDETDRLQAGPAIVLDDLRHQLAGPAGADDQRPPVVQAPAAEILQAHQIARRVRASPKALSTRNSAKANRDS